ncbi:MAG: sulfate/molybdate ABC transporter ATP-binding protein [Terriglobia bacterium]
MELQVELQREVRGFRLEVAFQAGEKTLGILGPSGSGKSMTLRAIAGLETGVEGRIALNGRALFDSKRGVCLPSRKRRVGFLLQDYALFPHMTVAQNVAFGLRELPTAAARKRVEENLARVQLAGLRRRYPRQLSGGEQQRAALARALATDPEILLLDEPLSALDVHLRSQMEALLVETLAAFRGVSLYVTHNLEEAYRISEQIVVMSRGRQAAFGSKEEIFRHPSTFTVAQVTGCKNFSRARAAASGKVEALDWGCEISVCEQIPEELEFAAIRAHHIAFCRGGAQTDSLPCALVRAIEGPFRMTLYLKLLTASAPERHHHLQAEITRENWSRLRETPAPWCVRLDPDRIMLLKKES